MISTLGVAALIAVEFVTLPPDVVIAKDGHWKYEERLSVSVNLPSHTTYNGAVLTLILDDDLESYGASFYDECGNQVYKPFWRLAFDESLNMPLIYIVHEMKSGGSYTAVFHLYQKNKSTSPQKLKSRIIQNRKSTFTVLWSEE